MQGTRTPEQNHVSIHTARHSHKNTQRKQRHTQHSRTNPYKNHSEALSPTHKCTPLHATDSAVPVQSCSQRQGLQFPNTQNNQPYPPDIEEPVQCAPVTEVVSASFSGLGGQVEETDSGCRVKVHGTHYPAREGCVAPLSPHTQGTCIPTACPIYMPASCFCRHISQGATTTSPRDLGGQNPSLQTRPSVTQRRPRSPQP